MSDQSKIEWTDTTWNPVRGCTKISPGCKHCYAEVFAERFRGVRGHPHERGFDLRLVPEKLHEPYKWRTPRMIFVNSMSDLFHEAVPDDYIVEVAQVMLSAQWHTFQVLTKRASRLAKLLHSRLREVARYQHIWWGVSVEDRKYGLPRVAHLAGAPAAVRFLSIEPLLEDLGTVPLKGIDWVIVGGESGAGARPISADWVQSIRDQCKGAGVAFFFKQWGGVPKFTSAVKRRNPYEDLWGEAMQFGGVQAADPQKWLEPLERNVKLVVPNRGLNERRFHYKKNHILRYRGAQPHPEAGSARAV